jgi:arsenite methyltransferase
VDGLVSGVRAAIKRQLYEGFGRDRWQRADEVVGALGLRPGARVADLGAGGGYFTFRLANAVGPAGKVYAVDVDEDLQAYVVHSARARGITNVEAIRGDRRDPRLPVPVDLLFSSDAYHHLADRKAYFTCAREYLRPGGRAAIIDHVPQGIFAGWLGHGTAADVIRREMEGAGFRLAQEIDLLRPRQHFLVFDATGARKQRTPASGGAQPGQVPVLGAREVRRVHDS